MRSKQAVTNTVVALLEELVSIICGFILPRMILRTFGSDYNGLATSITQFLRAAVLLRAGIGGATRAALYKPLAEKNHEQINRIIKATEIFMHRIALVLGVLIIITACIYPVFVSEGFSWWFTASLVLIIGISAFAESYFGITYQILLQADQRAYVFSIVKIGAVIANTCVAALLIKVGSSLHVVQFGNALAYAAIPIVINIYVRHKYKINTNVKPDMIAISQRWDAFAQQASAFVINNAGVVVITVFTHIKEVSVYTVYNMVITALNRVITSVTSGIEAAFGNIIAKKETESLNRNFRIVEYLVFMIANIIYVCAIVLILSFVAVYTKGVTDAKYIRPAFAYVFILSGFFNGVRLPYQLLVQAAGHYKQTKNGAIIEMIINITVSVILVIRFGVIGVAIGSLIATVFRTIQYTIYSSKKILNRALFVALKNYFCSGVFVAISLLVLHFLLPKSCGGYIEFIFQGFVSIVVTCLVAALVSLFFYRKELYGSIEIIKNLIKYRKRL